MKLENQVCSLELAKKLKTLGVKQESLFYWLAMTGQLVSKLETGGLARDYEPCSAFTVAELGRVLIEAGRENMPHYVHGQKCWAYHAEPDNWIEADIEADARAKMLIYLLENKRLTKGKE